MATTTVEAKTENLEAASQKSPTSPRKRRRRAPTTGAADDCFACQDRQSKCDRRRPYCTQCLDLGKDCSGYKTALTWGVGVASRGKLRGLAMPIAESKKAEQGTETKTENSKKRPHSEVSKLESTRKTPQSPTNEGSFCPTSAPTGINHATTNYGFVDIEQGSALISPMLPPPNLQWRTHFRSGHASTRPSKRQRRHSLEPLQVAPGHAYRDFGAMPMTANALDGYRTQAFGVSMQCSPVTPTYSNYDPYSPTYPECHALHYKDVPPPGVESSCSSAYFPAPELAWSGGSMSSSMGSDQDSHGYAEDQGFFADPVVVSTLDDLLASQPNMTQQDENNTVCQDELRSTGGTQYLASLEQSPPLVADDVGAHTSLAIPRPFPSLGIGKTPGLQFLIDYYDKVISPVIVAFDGPTNPYRTHILRLAVQSETLQHAIAALSASNLRMRRYSNSQSSVGTKRRSLTDCSHDNSVRKSSIAHSLMDMEMERLPQTSTSEPSMEELFHKTASIKALNAQLADPLRRKDDSILATLLILCLYHICDTGVAKFKTQFAGVKKILALRGGINGGNSKATNWLTVMFTWFDAMTATVNDREDQLADLDTLSNASDDWALENLAGCDGRLFKTIAKLGRLNLLSQSKPVRAESPSAPPKTSKPQARSSSPNSGKSQDYYSMNHNRFDGNGWSSLVPEDEALVPDMSDARAQFWREWTEVRKALQEWKLDASKTSTPKSHEDYLDLNNISESFRYSALLYTERLAYPHLPSTHPNFQHLVTQALQYIKHVKSDVFLLWPLFITGTECVSAEGRHLIRERCLDIQKDSGFFNNISGLELLEKVWRDDSDTIGLNEGGVNATGMAGSTNGMSHEGRGCGGLGSSGFKWRKAMDKVDGEYIVV